MQRMMQDEGLKCPRCQSERICKNGHKNGKQRFLCKECRRQFVEFRTQPGYDEAFKQICLQAYQNGKSFREIERTYGVHHTTVLSWVKQAGFDLSEMARSNPARTTSLEQTLQTESDSARTKEAILSGALKLFSMHGYASTRWSQISATAGISTQTLNRYFKDKETLFSALVQQLLTEMHRNLIDLPINDDAPTAPEVVLRRVAIALLTVCSEDQTLFVLIRLLVSEAGRFPELAKRFISEVERPIFDQLSTYLKFHPDVQIDDPLAATRMFVGSLMHYSLIQNVLQAQDPLLQDRDRMVDGLIAGIMAAAQ